MTDEKQTANGAKKGNGFRADAPVGEEMLQDAHDVHLAPGTRVQLTGAPIGVLLLSPTGVIVRPGDWDDYYIVRLDVPALYRNSDGTEESLPEIRQSADNFRVLTRKN